MSVLKPAYRHITPNNCTGVEQYTVVNCVIHLALKCASTVG